MNFIIIHFLFFYSYSCNSSISNICLILNVNDNVEVISTKK